MGTPRTSATTSALADAYKVLEGAASDAAVIFACLGLSSRTYMRLRDALRTIRRLRSGDAAPTASLHAAIGRDLQEAGQ